MVAAQKPLIIASTRNRTLYSAENINVNDEKNCVDCWNTIIFTSPEQIYITETMAVITSLKELLFADWSAQMIPRDKTRLNDPLLSAEPITNLPLKDADILGVKISENIFKELSKTKTPESLHQLFVWQSVAIDPEFEYQTYSSDTKDYIVAENALFQSEDITGMITDPSQLLKPREVEVAPAPSHEVLCANAIKRALMPFNATTTKHKVLLIYANDLALLNSETIATLTANNWFLAIIGDTPTLAAEQKERLESLKTNNIYINALGTTQEAIRDLVTTEYLASLNAKA